MKKKITNSSWLKTFLQKKYRDLLLKPALKLILNNQKYPTFWTMPFDTICRTIILDGYYEKTLLEGMCQLVPNKKGIVLDIGANIGNHTIFFSSVFSKVFSFEPIASNCWILKANLHLNNIKNVILIENGLSDKNAEMTTSSNDSHDTNKSLIDITENINDDQIKIKVLIGDEVIKQLQLNDPIVAIKIDVEGHEPNVIRGLTETIQKHQPIIYWEAFNINTVNQSKIVLKQLGYTHFYHLTSNKYSNKFINKLNKSFSSSAYLVDINHCSEFDGMNVASTTKLIEGLN